MSLTSVFCSSLLALGAPGSAIAAQQGKSRDQLAPVPTRSVSKTEKAVVEPVTINNAGETLKIAREAFGFNVTDLAEIFGVSRPTIYKWLKGGDVKREVYAKMQVLAAVSEHWKQNVGDDDMSFLLDYKGPQANQLSIREGLQGETLDPHQLKELINSRWAEYDKASAKSREMIGEVPPVKGDPIAQGIRRLNQQWTENANRLKSSGK